MANLKNYLSKSLALALVAFGLSGCGGGSSSATSATTLSASVGSLSNSTVTVGSAKALTGSEVVASLPSLLNRLRVMFTPLAFAANTQSCSNSAFLSTTDGVTWSTLGLTSASDTPPCVTQSQDAGKYLILQTSTLTDSSGTACDLIAIKKSDGTATCLTFNIPGKSEAGEITFYLDEASGQTPGQLTLNGKYFFIGFKATKNVTAAVHGFVRVDLDSASPTGFTAYARKGTASSVDSDDIDNKTIFWSPFYGLENGDMLVNLSATSAGQATGANENYYVVVDSTLTDATQAVAAKFSSHAANPNDGYDIDMTSLLGKWFSSVDSGVTYTAAHYNNDAISSLAVDGEHSVYFTVSGTTPVRQNLACSAQAQSLVKVTVDPTNGAVSYSDMSVSGLTSGLGTNYVTNNVTPETNGNNIFSLYLYKVDATHIKLVKSTKALSSNACSSDTDVGTYVVDSNLIASLNNNDLVSAFTFRTAETVFIQTFNYNPEDNSGNYGCASADGCPVRAFDVAYAYDIATGNVTAIDLSNIRNTNYRVAGEYSSITAKRVTLKIFDITGGAKRQIHAEMGVDDVGNVIKFPADATVAQGIFSGSE